MEKSIPMKPKPHAPACERNKDPILSIIQKVFTNVSKVLEIGSGTGEHGVYFAKHMPWLQWQCSDIEENLDGIRLWVEEYNLQNLLDPVELDVTNSKHDEKYDAFFTANTLHIISKEEVKNFFDLISKLSIQKSELIIYGPFNYNGNFTSESNAKFEIWLKERNILSGIRDFEWIEQLANKVDFQLVDDYEMPANNRCLHFQKRN